MSRFFIILGIIFLLTTGFLIYQRNTPKRLAFDIDSLPTTSVSSKKSPQVLIIESLGIRLPIIPAKISKSRWEATSEGVSFLSSSSIPGEIGNSILYGHNWPNILGKLTQAKPGQSIEVIFSDNTKKEFLIEFTSIVTPDEIHILDQTKDIRLTLYTCTGFLDSKRFVVTAIKI
ncbi:sortase [Candidatus Gottesmanbacteria bacterium]|nr:sortase [Candidatus Gottesmanbacteria bacterium]